LNCHPSQLCEGEAASLGPMWPKSRDLVSLQEQCLSVIYAMADAPRGGCVESGSRRKQACQTSLQILQLLSEFMEAIGYPQQRRASEWSTKEQISAIEDALNSGDNLPNLTTFRGRVLSTFSPTSVSPLSVQ